MGTGENDTRHFHCLLSLSLNSTASVDQVNSFHNNNNLDIGGVGGASDAPLFSTIKQPTHMVVVYVVAYSIIFIAALVGNTMVVAVVMLRPGMRSVTNLFIANLAVADMLVAVLCIPITLLDNIYYGWPFGSVLCKLTPYIQGVTVCASVYNLAAIAVDRYLAICFKPQFRIMRRGACLTLAGIWVFSFALMTPWLVYYQHFKRVDHEQSLEYCQPHWPSYKAEKMFFVVAIFLGTYLLPLLVVFLCYILVARRVWQRRAPGVAIGCSIIKRYRIKVIKMLVTVVAVFALSWLPLYLIYLLIYFDFSPDKQVYNHITNIGVPVAQWLELSNSGMNAIIYCFFSENFRRGFVDLYRCVIRRRVPNERGTSSTIPPRRVGRSMSEESTMMGSCVVRHPCRWQNRRKFLQACAMEKRYVWGNDHRHDTKSLDLPSHRTSSFGRNNKWPRAMELSRTGSLNDGQNGLS